MDIVEALNACHALGAAPARRWLEEISDRWTRQALREPVLAHLGVFWAPVTGEPGARWPVVAFAVQLGEEPRTLLVWLTVGGEWRSRTLRKRPTLERADPVAKIAATPALPSAR